ncbi:MAG: stage IV sporulation protein A, partial [Clostridium sp.]
MEILPKEHWLKSKVIQNVREMLKKIDHMRDVNHAAAVEDSDAVKRMKITEMKMADGKVQIEVEVDDSHYYQILSEFVGMPITGEYQLMQTLKDLAAMQREYEKVNDAMCQVRLKGYSVVTPDRGEIVLDEPQIIRHGNKFGVKMKAQAPSINLIKAHIETEIAPIVGSEQQAADLIEYIKRNALESEEGVWSTNIFGKSIEQIVDDGIQAKISQLTEDCQLKLQDTLQKIINDSNGGMICIII